MSADTDIFNLWTKQHMLGTLGKRTMHSLFLSLESTQTKPEHTANILL